MPQKIDYSAKNTLYLHLASNANLISTVPGILINTHMCVACFNMLVCVVLWKWRVQSRISALVYSLSAWEGTAVQPSRSRTQSQRGVKGTKGQIWGTMFQVGICFSSSSSSSMPLVPFLLLRNHRLEPKQNKKKTRHLITGSHKVNEGHKHSAN